MKYKVDVIIPSLGNPVLLNTIKSLNSGTYKPNKIICLIYNKKKVKLKRNYDNVEFYYTSIKGQTLQRHLAFKKSKEKYILQLDDDIILNKDCLEKLVKSLIRVGRQNVVGPIYKDFNDQPIHKINRRKFGILYNLYHYLICNSKFGSKKAGTLTDIFLSYGLDASVNYKEKILKTDWLPGGCILSYRSDFIKKPQYPFRGKAYCEDVFYSILRNRKKIKHNAVTQAIVKTHNVNVEINTFYKEVKVRYYLIRKFNKHKTFKFYIWLILEFLKRFVYTFYKMINKI